MPPKTPKNTEETVTNDTTSETVGIDVAKAAHLANWAELMLRSGLSHRFPNWAEKYAVYIENSDTSRFAGNIFLSFHYGWYMEVNGRGRGPVREFGDVLRSTHEMDGFLTSAGWLPNRRAYLAFSTEQLSEEEKLARAKKEREYRESQNQGTNVPQGRGRGRA